MEDLMATSITTLLAVHNISYKERFLIDYMIEEKLSKYQNEIEEIYVIDKKIFYFLIRKYPYIICKNPHVRMNGKYYIVAFTKKVHKLIVIPLLNN